MSIKLFHHDPTVTGCSVEGVGYTADAAGAFEVEDAHAAHLLDHGFTTTPPEGFTPEGPTNFMVELAKKTRAQIAAYALEAYGVELDETQKKDALLEQVAVLAGKAADAARLAELEAKDPADLTEDEAAELVALQEKE